MAIQQRVIGRLLIILRLAKSLNLSLIAPTREIKQLARHLKLGPANLTIKCCSPFPIGCPIGFNKPAFSASFQRNQTSPCSPT
jgi:hypothetical protein